MVLHMYIYTYGEYMTSYMVYDMFFLNSWNPKNGENWLVLVLTCFFSTPGIQKMGEID